MTHLQGTDFPPGGFAAQTALPIDFAATPYTNDLPGADLDNNRFVVPAAGLYQLIGNAEFCPQTTHYSSMHIKVNGTSVAYASSSIAQGCRTVKAQETLRLAQGDAITMTVFDSVNGPTYGISGIMLTVVRLR